MNKQSPKAASMQRKLALSAIAGGIMAIYSGHAAASVTNPTIGALLWSEEFNGTTLNTNIWNVENGNGCQIGLCGYGNAELQTYTPNNLSVGTVPFEANTRALAIAGSSSARVFARNPSRIRSRPGRLFTWIDP